MSLVNRIWCLAAALAFLLVAIRPISAQQQQQRARPNRNAAGSAATGGDLDGGGPVDGKTPEPGLGGGAPTEVAKKESKLSEKRAWQLTAQLSSIVPENAGGVLGQMLKEPDACKNGDEKSCSEPVEAARELIQILAPQCAKERGSAECPQQWLIHVLDLDGGLSDQQKKYTNRITRSRVFLYRAGSSLEEYQGSRVFGETAIGTLLIGRDAAVADPSLTQDDRKVDGHHLFGSKPFLVPGSCSKTEEERNPDGCFITARFSMADWGKGFVAAKGSDGRTYLIPDFALETGQFAAAKKKQQAWLSNLQSVLSLAGMAALQKAENLDKMKVVPKHLFGVGLMKKLPVPSDIWVQAGKVTEDIARTLSRMGELGIPSIETFEMLSSEAKIANERRYWFDFSIGLPVKKVDELQYSATPSGVLTKDIAAESILGLFNVVLWKKGLDLDNPKNFPYPRLLVGLGLRGRVMDRPFVGMGFGLGWGGLSKVPILRDLQPYAGIQRTVTQVGTEAAAAGVRPSSAWKLAIGINVPVKQIAERLSKKDTK